MEESKRQDPNLLDITNICRGAVQERFRAAVAEVMDNIFDCNTDPTKVRKITLEFSFEPFKNRDGAVTTFKVKTNLVPLEEVEGNVFFAATPGGVMAYARDPKQEHLFREQPVETVPQ